MPTRAETLLKHLGDKVECDFCHQKKTFSQQWTMTPEEQPDKKYAGMLIMCPRCTSEHPEKLRVSI